jgi:hypothetical protein
VNWGIGQPNNLGNQDCLAVKLLATGMLVPSVWADEACTDTYPYVCDAASAPSGCALVSLTRGPRAFCAQSASFTTARTACEGVGGTLLHPRDALDDGEVFAEADARFPAGAAAYWIGAVDTVTEGAWFWLDDASPLATP